MKASRKSDLTWLSRELLEAIEYETKQIASDHTHNAEQKWKEKLRDFYQKVLSITKSNRTESRKCLLIRELIIKAIKRGYCNGVMFYRIEQLIVLLINKRENPYKAMLIEKEHLKHNRVWYSLKSVAKRDILDAIADRCKLTEKMIIERNSK